MAIIYADGFEHARLAGSFISTTATPTFSATGKRSGGYALVLSLATSQQATIAFTAAAEVYIQQSFQYTNAQAQDFVVSKWQSAAGTILGTLVIDGTSKYLKTYTGDSATLVATGTHAIDVNTQYLIELHIKIADANGTIQVMVDENSDSSFTGDTQPGADTTVGRYMLNAVKLAGVGTSYVDDVIVCNTSGTKFNTWIGGLKIINLSPTGDDTVTWTPSTGVVNYGVVDDIPVVSTDHVNTNTNDQKDILTLADLPAEVVNIQAVQAWAFIAKTATSTPTKANVGVISGAAESASSDATLLISGSRITHILESDPNGTIDWTDDAVDALKLRYESKA